MFDINVLRGRTYATIRAAFNHSREILEEHGDVGSCNITGILTKILQDVGRFSERWSSDALFSIDTLRDLAGDGREKYSLSPDEPFDEVFAFGIRQDGVDGNSYILSSLAQSRDRFSGYVYPERRYRRILAVRCRAFYDRDMLCTRAFFSLRDISSSIHGIQDADFDTNKNDGSVLALPLENKTSPMPDERNAIDLEDVNKAIADGFVRFEARAASQDTLKELAKQGCAGDFKCVEIIGFYGDAVPQDKNKGSLVCRCFSSSHAFTAAWVEPGYAYYSGAMGLVKWAKETWEFELGPIPDGTEAAL